MGKRKYGILCLAVLLLFAAVMLNIGRSFTYQLSLQTEKDIYRGLWVASVGNLDLPSRRGGDAPTLQREVDALVDRAAEDGYTAIFYQLSPCSDALYLSEIFPLSVYLTGEERMAEEGDFDLLAYLIERAGRYGIAVHAWINPLRVTSGTPEAPQHDLSVLCTENPAVRYAAYTVACEDGKVYYDPGYPEVRELIYTQITEIVHRYDVAGVVFDDYFYPYPVGGKAVVFDDSASYALYGQGMALDDWRRENINRMIQVAYTATKTAGKEILFGVSPFGIRRNADAGTAGLDAYSTIYCDPLAWARGGYVDYLAPQLYWEIGNRQADFADLAMYWNEALSRTDTFLLIAQADYSFGRREIYEQRTFARQLPAYRGYISYYGGEYIREN